jgi:hypothetical protein
MAQQDLDYIRNNYLTIDQLSQRTGLTTIAILNLIEEKVIPAASYTTVESIEISSPLGDSITHKTTTDYYTASTVQLLLNYAASADLGMVKATFKTQFRKHLLSHPDRHFAYGNIFNDADYPIEDKFEKAFEAEWEAYTAGIYGICTLNATEEEIVKKEIAVKKLIEFNSKFAGQTLSEQQKEELQTLTEEFDSVANLFAPYQRENSSRGKYLDKILLENELADLVKHY